MEIANLIPHIESLIFASEKPLTAAEITELINNAFGFMEDKIATEQIDAALEGVVEKYRSEFYPFEVRQSGGGWQFLTKKEYHKTVAQLNGEKFLKRLSGAALETLAIIAYKQPITKGEIEGIRGVSTDYTIQKLLEKELIIITGRNEQLPGHPLVYCTSKTFMDYFGLNSTDDLPKIREVLAEQMVEPTVVNHTEFDPSETLSVSDNGELIDAEPESDPAGGAAPEEGGLNGHAFEAAPDEEEEEEQRTGDEPAEVGATPGETMIDGEAGDPDAAAFMEDVAEDEQADPDAGISREDGPADAAGEDAVEPDAGSDTAEEGAFGAQGGEEDAGEETPSPDAADEEISLNHPEVRLYIDEDPSGDTAEKEDEEYEEEEAGAVEDEDEDEEDEEKGQPS